MTSLDLAFEEDFEPLPPQPPPKKKPPQQQQEMEEYQPPPQQQPQPRQTTKPEQFTNYYPYQEQQIQISQPRPQQSYQYSFWDRMVMSRREVMKLFILSIVIILGISLEKIGYHYINQYLSSNDLTSIQELLVRLSFPIIVFIILWIIKSL
jgi:hypothetical protein